MRGEVKGGEREGEVTFSCLLFIVLSSSSRLTSS
jgi:hypothetical protein